MQVPLSFVRSKKVKLTWDPARNALGRVRYTVSVGKRVLARDLDRTSLRFRTKRLRDGRLDVKVTARDRLGQRISSTEAVLRLDRKPPRVSAAALESAGCGSGSWTASGPVSRAPARSRISFGDGKRGRGTRVVHSYKRPGVYRVIVAARDRAGNLKRLKLKVRVR